MLFNMGEGNESDVEEVGNDREDTDMTASTAIQPGGHVIGLIE